MPPKRNRCFNCSSERMEHAPLCRDCLRMAIITTAFGGITTETLHKLFELPWVQILLRLFQ